MSSEAQSRGYDYLVVILPEIVGTNYVRTLVRATDADAAARIAIDAYDRDLGVIVHVGAVSGLWHMLLSRGARVLAASHGSHEAKQIERMIADQRQDASAVMRQMEQIATTIRAYLDDEHVPEVMRDLLRGDGDVDSTSWRALAALAIDDVLADAWAIVRKSVLAVRIARVGK